MKGKPVNQTKEAILPPTPSAETQPPAQARIEVNPGNVPIVTVQLLNDINLKLGKILAILEKNNG